MAITFPVQGFATVAQNYISRGIASNFYSKAPLLAILGALTLGNNRNTDLKIGRPDSGEILSGGMISPIQRKQLGSVNAYLPRVQGFKTNNTAARSGSGRVALPDVANKTTSSHGQANQFAAEFHWTHIDTPILIWHEDKIRAGQSGSKEGASIAMGQVIDESTEIAYQDQVDWLADAVWNGSPGTQSDDLWDTCEGIVEATKTNNTYARVNRATTGNDPWRSQVDSTITAVDIKKLVDDANLAKGLRVKSGGADLFLTNTTLYQQFKAQVLGGGGVIVQGSLPQNMAKLGVKQEVLQLDNAYITYDPTCAANTVVAMTTSKWRFMVHPLFNFKVTPFEDNTTKGIAKDAYDFAYVQTRFMLTCDDPTKQVRYTAIGT